MRRDSLFWGGALILVGVLLYLQVQGIVNNVFQYFWPIAMMLVGGWLILGVYWRPAPISGETFSIPLDPAAQKVAYSFSHGVGQLDISGGAPVGQALMGTDASGMNRKSRLNGDQLSVRVEAGPSFLPFLGPSEGVWRFQLACDLPALVSVEAGASSINIDLKDVLAKHLVVKTGASSVNVTMPARGVCLFDLDGGATSVNILIPEMTAARIRVDGVTSMDVDTNRFPRLGSDLYQSSDFEAATDRAEININSGLGRVKVR
jgi:hypothetical protein